MIDIASMEAALKAEARKQYLRFRTLTSAYDCGAALASYINPEVERARQAFNQIMDRLAVIDPNCPKGRL